MLFRFAREVGWRYVPIAGSDAGNHLAWCPSSDEEDSSSEAGTYELDNIMSSSEAASDMASTIPGSSAGHEECPSSDEEDSSSEAGPYELDNIMSSSEAASDMASTIAGSSAGHEDSSEVISVEDDFEPVD